MELSILRYSSLCRRVVGFVGKRSARTTVGFEGEDPSRVFYSRLQGYRSSETLRRKRMKQRGLSLLFGVKRFARPSPIPASLSPLRFFKVTLSRLALEKVLLATKRTPGIRKTRKIGEEGSIEWGWRVGSMNFCPKRNRTFKVTDRSQVG